MSITTHWTRVIVLTPPPEQGGPEMSEALKAEFEQRDWFAVHHDDPYSAMAELCLRERSQTARSSWGVRRIEQVALVIVQQDHWRAAEIAIGDLINAVRTYLPHSSIWEAAGEELRLIHGDEGKFADSPVTEDLVPNMSRVVRQGQASSAGAQPLRYSARGSAPVIPHAAIPVNGETAEPKAGTRLTREEIDMLLDDRAPVPQSEAS